LAFLRHEERHVGGDRQLRHLERHGNDHAQNCGSDHDRGSASALWRGRQLAFEPFKRTKREYRRFHWACTDRAHLAGGPLIIATADAPMRKRSWSGFSTSIRTGNRCATRTQFSSRFTLGTPEGGRSISPSGFTAHPIPCTLPRKRWLGADERETLASLPGATCRISA